MNESASSAFSAFSGNNIRMVSMGIKMRALVPLSLPSHFGHDADNIEANAVEQDG